MGRSLDLHRRKPRDSDRDVPSCVVTYPYPPKKYLKSRAVAYHSRKDGVSPPLLAGTRIKKVHFVKKRRACPPHVCALPACGTGVPEKKLLPKKGNSRSTARRDARQPSRAPAACETPAAATPRPRRDHDTRASDDTADVTSRAPCHHRSRRSPSEAVVAPRGASRARARRLRRSSHLGERAEHGRGGGTPVRERACAAAVGRSVRVSMCPHRTRDSSCHLDWNMLGTFALACGLNDARRTRCEVGTRAVEGVVPASSRRLHPSFPLEPDAALHSSAPSRH